MRQTWNKHFMSIAYQVAEMSTCVSGRKVGAVFVKDNRILATGYNAVPSKYPHPDKCERVEQGFKSGEALNLCVCLHAEINAITNAAKHGIALEGSTVYCTTKPCKMCMGSLANVGVSRIYCDENYNDSMSDKIAEYARIMMWRIKD